MRDKNSRTYNIYIYTDAIVSTMLLSPPPPFVTVEYWRETYTCLEVHYSIFLYLGLICIILCVDANVMPGHALVPGVSLQVQLEDQYFLIIYLFTRLAHTISHVPLSSLAYPKLTISPCSLPTSTLLSANWLTCPIRWLVSAMVVVTHTINMHTHAQTIIALYYIHDTYIDRRY